MQFKIANLIRIRYGFRFGQKIAGGGFEPPVYGL